MRGGSARLQAALAQAHLHHHQLHDKVDLDVGKHVDTEFFMLLLLLLLLPLLLLLLLSPPPLPLPPPATPAHTPCCATPRVPRPAPPRHMARLQALPLLSAPPVQSLG